MAGPQSFDKEKVQLNVARIKKQGQVFQIVIDPELALEYKKGKKIDIRDILKSEAVFEDPKKGLRNSEAVLESVFGTKDPIEIAKTIIEEGELQITSEQREKEVEQKLKQIIHIIHINAIDPSTKLPHPESRIKNAMEEAKIKIDASRSAEEQVDQIVSQLRPILPIKFAVKKIEVILSGAHAAKLYSTVKGFGKLVNDDWLSDGSWRAVVEIPAGLQPELIDTLNSKTHGGVMIKIVE